jgi:D-aminopeptidase
VGRRIAPADVPVPSGREGAGSIIVVIATDAPLLPHQCAALARRATLGIARTGGTGESDSGDLVLAFSTGNRVRTEAEERSGEPVASISALAGSRIDPLYDAVIEATEESIVNCLVAASTVTGRGGATAHAINHDELRSLLMEHD